MPRLRTPDLPIGRPSFELSEDQIATVLDLVCRGAHEAHAHVQAGMLEVPITIIVRKAIRSVKKELGLTNLQVRGEHELENMATMDPTILGRIDITLQFLHQFGDEDAYVAVECKRVGAGLHQLNARYVTEGVHRFLTGQYAGGHRWGFMLGYVLVLPVAQLIESIDRHIRRAYGDSAQLAPGPEHPQALAVKIGSLQQQGGRLIRLNHIFVDMTSAAPETLGETQGPRGNTSPLSQAHRRSGGEQLERCERAAPPTSSSMGAARAQP